MYALRIMVTAGHAVKRAAQQDPDQVLAPLADPAPALLVGYGGATFWPSFAVAYTQAMAIDVIEVMVEIPRGSRNKYEFDKERGVFVLDRVLYSSVHYPTDYGYVTETLGEDGDALDALVVVNEPTFPGCHIMSRPIGVLDMRDEKGPDHKILAVPLGDPRFQSVVDLATIDAHWLREIENFFQTYKALEDKWTEVVGWEDVNAAERYILAARDRYPGPARGAH